mmetsp:Transcript_19882/g.63997  ORF Transcript_19882/g.63997 Transcript_19882/m.63997 type:complete len:218 (+) Transcript_19882:704-1357(+)
MLQQNQFLQGQLRFLMREPLAKQLDPHVRGYVTRKKVFLPRCRDAGVVVQTWWRMAAAGHRFELMKGAVVLIQASTRTLLVCANHRVGKIVSRLRVLERELDAADDASRAYDAKLRAEKHKSAALTTSLLKARAKLYAFKIGDPVVTVGLRRGHVAYTHSDDGTYDIDYVDGTKEVNVPGELLLEPRFRTRDDAVATVCSWGRPSNTNKKKNTTKRR